MQGKVNELYRAWLEVQIYVLTLRRVHSQYPTEYIYLVPEILCVPIFFKYLLMKIAWYVCCLNPMEALKFYGTLARKTGLSFVSSS